MSISSPALAALGALTEICNRFSMARLAVRVQETAEWAKERDLVDVVVLGRFKSGKSSLLNALLGRSVLPVDVLPTTAVVTRITGGQRDQATIVGEGGATRSVSLHEMSEFVSESANPGNTRGVARVDLELAGVPMLSHLRFVDTPGIGSLHYENTQATERWFPRVGAALVAISVEQPLSEHDVALLEALRAYTPLLTIVLTKSDLVSPGELTKIEQYVSRHAAERLPYPVRVLAVSTRRGHDRQLETLRDLLVGLTRSGDEILIHKVQALAEAAREYLAVALEAARRGALVRAELRTVLEEERRRIKLLDHELALISGHLRQQVLLETERHFLPHQAGMTADLLRELERGAHRWRGTLAGEVAAFRAWLEASLDSRLRQIGLRDPDAWREILEEADLRVSRVVGAFSDRISGKVQAALGFAFSGAAFEARPKTPEHPSLHLGHVFETNYELVSFLIPMRLFRGLAHRHFRSVVAWEVEKHLYRLSSQWTEAISTSIDEIVAAARDHVRDEIDTLTGLLGRTSDESGGIREALEELERVGRLR